MEDGSKGHTNIEMDYLRRSFGVSRQLRGEKKREVGKENGNRQEGEDEIEETPLK